MTSALVHWLFGLPAQIVSVAERDEQNCAEASRQTRLSNDVRMCDRRRYAPLDSNMGSAVLAFIAVLRATGQLPNTIPTAQVSRAAPILLDPGSLLLQGLGSTIACYVACSRQFDAPEGVLAAWQTVLQDVQFNGMMDQVVFTAARCSAMTLLHVLHLREAFAVLHRAGLESICLLKTHQPLLEQCLPGFNPVLSPELVHRYVNMLTCSNVDREPEQALFEFQLLLTLRRVDLALSSKYVLQQMSLSVELLSRYLGGLDGRQLSGSHMDDLYWIVSAFNGCVNPTELITSRRRVLARLTTTVIGGELDAVLAPRCRSWCDFLCSIQADEHRAPYQRTALLTRLITSGGQGLRMLGRKDLLPPTDRALRMRALSVSQSGPLGSSYRLIVGYHQDDERVKTMTRDQLEAFETFSNSMLSRDPALEEFHLAVARTMRSPGDVSLCAHVWRTQSQVARLLLVNTFQDRKRSDNLKDDMHRAVMANVLYASDLTIGHMNDVILSPAVREWLSAQVVEARQRRAQERSAVRSTKLQQPTANQPAGAQASGEQPAGAQPAGEQPAGEQAAGEQPASEQPVGVQPAGVQAAGEQPAGEQAADEQAADQPAAVAQPVVRRRKRTCQPASQPTRWSQRQRRRPAEQGAAPQHVDLLGDDPTPPRVDLLGDDLLQPFDQAGEQHTDHSDDQPFDQTGESPREFDPLDDPELREALKSFL